MRKVTTLFYLICFCSNVFSQDNSTNRIYEIWDDQPAPNRGADYAKVTMGKGYPYDADWETESYPIGNGYMGANIFGRTDVERIQITEKTLANEGVYGWGGLTNFAEVYLDIGHQNPKNYKRILNLNEGILSVSYEQDGVKYSREYFANYPENIIAIKLNANESKKISFTLSAEIPYLRGTAETNTRTGKSFAENDLITLSGNVAHFNINYEAQIKIINEGGELIARNTNRNAEIKIANANSVILLIAAGTNYELKSHIFNENEDNEKLDGNSYPHAKVSDRITHATNLGYKSLKTAHLKDYQNLFKRVQLSFTSEVPELKTRTLLANYNKGLSNAYLEELMFHFGRYLLIASSRKGTLPSGLQGVWSQYLATPWTGGYWHNINVQMNYWGAFNANLAETFIPYVEYFQAYHPKAKDLATGYIQEHNPAELDTKDNDIGWTIGTGANVYNILPPGAHSGPGTGGFTTKLLWDYFEFTQDTSYLQMTGYPALLGMSKFLSKTLKPAENGILLVDPSASPEISLLNAENKYMNRHYITKGTTFDQGFVWETYNDALKAAEIVGAKDDFLDILRSQIVKLDPILIGTSGQVKEFREENGYGEIGDPHHRHVSHLCPLYPGTLINSSTPDWLEGVQIALDFRGNKTTGWAMAHRMNLRARTKEAEKAHEVYSKFIKERTCPNLWTLHPPFQIDGNLGCMAGVIEMLVQSHEGFIELHPALPKVWKTGEFKGLMARGNFELSAKWENSKVSHCNIIAKSGGKCRIKSKNIDGAQVVDSEGKTIPFAVEMNNIIEFDTNESEEYKITFY